MASSMKIEFSEKDDLRQACYEATVDLVRYTTHLEGIAQRCEKHFPEVAAGLRGTVAGIGQYLQGVEGKWRTLANEHARAALSGPDFAEHMWAYEFCRDPRAALLLMGSLAGVASAKPDLTFWQALTLARVKLGDMQPLIEQLLASSPRRAQ
jgi:hypothetical protein